jgi:hypothetical protein
LKKKVCLGIEGLLCVWQEKGGKNLKCFMGGVEVCPRKKCIDKYSQIKQAQAKRKAMGCKGGEAMHLHL